MNLQAEKKNRLSHFEAEGRWRKVEEDGGRWREVEEMQEDRGG